jgi:hypothetical protein
LGVEGPWVCSEIESRGRLQQQRSERFYLYRREEKSCMGACSGTWKLVVPWVRLEIGFCSLRVKRSLRCKQIFPGKEKCLLGQLSPFGTYCSLSFKIAKENNLLLKNCNLPMTPKPNVQMAL